MARYCTGYPQGGGQAGLVADPRAANVAGYRAVVTEPLPPLLNAFPVFPARSLPDRAVDGGMRSGNRSVAAR